MKILYGLCLVFVALKKCEVRKKIIVCIATTNLYFLTKFDRGVVVSEFNQKKKKNPFPKVELTLLLTTLSRYVSNGAILKKLPLQHFH